MQQFYPFEILASYYYTLLLHTVMLWLTYIHFHVHMNIYIMTDKLRLDRSIVFSKNTAVVHCS
jgi:hypothetical protein